MPQKFKIFSTDNKSKGLKIFKSSAYKEHEGKPVAQLFWSLRWVAVIWIACAIAFGLSFIFEHLWRYGWTPASAKWAGLFLKKMIFTCGMSVIAEIPFWLSRCFLRPDLPCIIPLIPIIIYGALADSTLIKEFNPHGKDKFKERSSHKATEEDIKKMGLFNGFMIVLGYFKKRVLMMDECLSALCVAPPATGKTQGVVLPTIFDCNTVSMIINDPKPELYQSSSAYRATIGPVFIMNWAGQDDPEHGIYYPSWNPLSPEHVPFDPAQRDLYVDSICKILVPDNPSSSADPHWALTGRAGLSGLIQFIISKIERAKADDYFYSRISAGTFDSEDASVLSDYYLSMIEDPNAYAALSLLQKGELTAQNYVHVGTWANIPDDWVGKEASLSMLTDWLNASQIAMAAELEERRRQGDQMVMMADRMQDIFLNAVEEARRYAYAHRAVLELTQLANTPDRERGSVISTIMSGIAIFRNIAVRNRTSHSDFHFSDMRGIVDPRDGKIKPVTVYLSINMVDAKALNPITGIFIELMSNYLLANPPEQYRNGKKMGPYPVLFILDEMPQMQPLDAVIRGPDLGRGQKISYLIIGQDIHQIADRYGQDAAATIISTTAAKIVLRQNDPDTAKKFSEMMGEEMKIKLVYGPDNKVMKEGDRDKEEVKIEPLYSPMDIMKLPAGKQLVIFQGWYHKPIEADQVMAWKDPRMSAFMAMGATSPLPEFLIPSHHQELHYSGFPRVYRPETKELLELRPAN